MSDSAMISFSYNYRESCLSLEYARNDSSVAMDRQTMMSPQNHRGSCLFCCTVLHANNNVQQFLKQERNHRQPIFIPSS